MSKTELVARRLDVSARGVDILTSLTNMANSPHSVVHMGIELGRWLNRERLSESQLQLCLEKARGLVMANSRGNDFYKAVMSGSRQRAVGPLFSQPSGSLGRMMTDDPFLCWLTSTTACLFEFHGEDFISDVLCSFIMQAHNDGGKTLKEYQLAWHPLRLQLKPVLQKIVSSMWFNVVNSGVVKRNQQEGLTSLPLPTELKEVCPRGHNMESHRLGSILCQLREAEGEVVIESDNIITNLTLWLIYHFKGRLRVVVSGKIVYDEVLGPEEALIEHRTKKFCSTDGPCEDVSNAKVKILFCISGDIQRILSGTYDTQMTMEQTPRVRQKLYQPLKYPLGASGKESIRVLVRQTAFEIVSWILRLRLRREASNNEILFNVILSEAEEQEELENLYVGDILARVPSVVNMGWGDIKAAVVVFSPPSGTESSTLATKLDENEEMDFESAEDLESVDSDSAEPTPEYILQYFPILRDLMEKVRRSCRCHHCLAPKGNLLLKEGCLRHTAFMEVMTYIGHSISDAFGADDCSQKVTRVMEDFGVLQILYDITLGSIKWRAWLDTAARVLLGSPSIDELVETRDDEDYTVKSDFFDADLLASTVIVVQHGSLAVVAPWLDISQPLSLMKCFGFKIVQGRLGLYAPDGSQFQSLQGESTVIETRHSDDVQNYTESYPLACESAGAQVSLKLDTCDFKTEFLLVPTGSNQYKLLMRVVSDSHSRFLDPTRAMIKLTQPVMSVSCSHKFDSIITIQSRAPRLKMYSYEELLGRWPDGKLDNLDETAEDFKAPGQAAENNDNSDDDKESAFPAGQYYRIPASGERFEISDIIHTFRVSQVLDSYLKYNTALALTFSDVTILTHGPACLSCILHIGAGLAATNGIVDTNQNRWVICRSKHPEMGRYADDQHYSESRKRIRAAR
ncbi:hypothetical protein BJ875DRAFT_383626 [Amylocarpus encephaloides]|uniref:Uncharacterized protein n=1 Tax=Amylocarpus encephaloides TaxID=45428 RepID=A0A9P7YCD0_9HELO|nr:hypothetical protein BJ875DRAFT_383626 [Amylocarpus encephaloides]